jgi:8-oxo-dGTP pyrophosphatase MutT (NUDIX family)
LNFELLLRLRKACSFCRYCSFQAAGKVLTGITHPEEEHALPGNVGITRGIHGDERELEEETGLKDIELTQFRTFSQVDRDPRTRVITTVFFGEALSENTDAKGGDDAAGAQWYDIDNLPPLGFDHSSIIRLLKDCSP